MLLLQGEYRSHWVVIMATECLSCYMLIVYFMLLLAANPTLLILSREGLARLDILTTCFPAWLY